MKNLYYVEGCQKNVSDYEVCDFIKSGYYEDSVSWSKNALEKQKIEILHLPTAIAQQNFLDSLDELRKYDAILFNDINSKTRLFDLETLNKSAVQLNYLSVIKTYGCNGRGFARYVIGRPFKGNRRTPNTRTL
jgi:uncharacterized membrane protein